VGGGRYLLKNKTLLLRKEYPAHVGLSDLNTKTTGGHFT